MDENFVPNLLSLTLFFVSLFIALRALYLYTRSRSRRIFILSLSMGVISLTAVAGFFWDKSLKKNLHFDLFYYIVEKGSYIFIFVHVFYYFCAYLSQLLR